MSIEWRKNREAGSTRLGNFNTFLESRGQQGQDTKHIEEKP